MWSYLYSAPGSSAFLRKKLLHALLEGFVLDALDAVSGIDGNEEALDGQVDYILKREATVRGYGERLEHLKPATVVIGDLASHTVHRSASSFRFR